MLTSKHLIIPSLRNVLMQPSTFKWKCLKNKDIRLRKRNFFSTVIGRAHKIEKVPKAAIQNEDCNPGNLFQISPLWPHHMFFISETIKLSD